MRSLHVLATCASLQREPLLPSAPSSTVGLLQPNNSYMVIRLPAHPTVMRTCADAAARHTAGRQQDCYFTALQLGTHLRLLQMKQLLLLLLLCRLSRGTLALQHVLQQW